MELGGAPPSLYGIFFGTPHLLYGKIRQTVFAPLPKSKHNFCIQNYSVKV